MKSLVHLALLLTVGLLLSCAEQNPVSPPSPQELSRDAIGYFCHMTVLEHDGPKGQIMLSDSDHPLWFVSVRDTLAFTVLPGEPKNIAAIYVTDVGQANWDRPEPGTWIDAHQAWYVVGSDRMGGMGAPEIVPFGRKADAERFLMDHGGEITDFDSIGREQLLQSQ